MALIGPVPSFVASAMIATCAPDTWSHERVQVFQGEIAARFRYESRVSAQVEDDANEPYEFEAIPLVAAQTVRVRFRDIGQLPVPGYFKEEPVLDE